MRRNVYTALGAQWLSAAMGIVASVLVARMMQPVELGVFTTTMAISGVVGTLQMAGANEYLLYSKHVDLATRRSVFGMTIILTLIVCSAMVLGRPLWIAIYGNPGVADVASVIAVQMALWMLVAPIASMFAREQRFDLVSAAALAQNATLSVLQVTFVWAGFSYMGLAYAALGSGVVSMIAHLLLGRQHLLVRPSFRNLRPIAGFGSKLFAANALNMINSNAPPILLGAMSGLAQSALYGRANMIVQIYSQTVARAVDPLINAQIAADTRTGRGATATLVGSSKMLLTLAVAFFGFIALASPLIVPLVFGNQWAPAAPVMRVLAIGLMVWPLSAPTAALLLAAERPGVLIRLRTVNAVARVSVILTLASLGLVAVAIGIAACAYLNLAQSIHAARRYGGINVRAYLAALVPSLMTAVVPLAVTAAALAGLRALDWSGWPLLIAIGCVMAITQLVALAGFRHPLWDEVQVISGKLRARRA